MAISSSTRRTVADNVLRTVASFAQDADALLAHLLAEMTERWATGQRPLADEFLDRHPELQTRPGAVLRLLERELQLHHEHGLEISTARLVKRHPEHRTEVQALLNCPQTVPSARTGVLTAQPGERLGDYQLVALLGRGGQGSVFLAVQPALADRAVVVKVTSCQGEEHRSLARLQHTHIVPLYTAQELPGRNLRLLCMPYLGGITFERLLQQLAGQPPFRRTGQGVRDALTAAESLLPVAVPAHVPALAFLARASYVQAVCWVGACLAEALQYAHERGVVHLDLKPSNVLLTAEGQPMLLDFHLAQEPLRPGGLVPEWTGGTPQYMSPEQRETVVRLAAGQPVTATVDGRSDIYSLGMLLYEALAGRLPAASNGVPPRLDLCNPAVDLGVADVVAKCLARDPADRYADAGGLADDLRRYLTDRPLRGVRNRSLSERWRRWRSRRPHGLAWASMACLVVAGFVLSAVVTGTEMRQRSDAAEAALHQGRERERQQNYPASSASLRERLGTTELVEPARNTATQGSATAWDHYLLGRAAFRACDYALATDELEQAVRSEPESFWPNFTLGLCAHQSKDYRRAVEAFSTCLGCCHSQAALARSYYNRGLAHAALGETDRAVGDYSEALAHDETLTDAALNRGTIYYRLARYDAAAADFRRALTADPAAASYNLALVARTQGDDGTASEYIRQTLQHNPTHREALEVRKQLRRDH